MANPFPFVAGEVLTAADMNGIGEWTSYTPTWTASTTNPTIGNGNLVARYARIQDLIQVQFHISFGTTTTAGSGQYRVSLPVTAATAISPYTAYGSGYILDSSAGAAYVTSVLVSNSSTTNVIMKITGSGFGDVTATSPFTFTNLDEINGSFFYRAA
jgi:hypothetical protein